MSSLPSPRLLQELAHEAGFDLVGFGPASPGPFGERFRTWLHQGRHGRMAWLERDQARILDPTRLLSGARSSIALGFDYTRPAASLPGGGRVARYAAGRDYHRALGRRLEGIRQRLVSEGVPSESLRLGVDAVPVLERALAAQAGVGFLAKSSGIIHPRLGPWVLLAEILTTAELPASGPAPGTCGTCTACLEACPTQAIVAPYELDARRCLSYTTIELRGPIPRELRQRQADWLFGCDVCIEVCPFTRRSLPSPHPELADHRVVETWDLVGVLALPEPRYQAEWTGTAMRRARREGLRRNAAIVLGNLGRVDAAPALAAALEDADAGVRTSAAWALSRLGRERPAVERARARESDAAVRGDLELSLAEWPA